MYLRTYSLGTWPFWSLPCYRQPQRFTCQSRHWKPNLPSMMARLTIIVTSSWDYYMYGSLSQQWRHLKLKSWKLVVFSGIQTCSSLCLRTERYQARGIISQGSLTHWGRGAHICVSKLAIVDSDNGLSSGRRQAIIWTNAGIFIGILGTNIGEISIEIYTFSSKKMYLKMSSRPQFVNLTKTLNRTLQVWCRCSMVDEISILYISPWKYALYRTKTINKYKYL